MFLSFYHFCFLFKMQLCSELFSIFPERGSERRISLLRLGFFFRTSKIAFQLITTTTSLHRKYPSNFHKSDQNVENRKYQLPMAYYLWIPMPGCLWGVRLGSVRLGKVRLGQAGLGQDRLSYVNLGQVRLSQVRKFFKIDFSMPKCHRQVQKDQLLIAYYYGYQGLWGVGLGSVRLGQVWLGLVRLGQARLGQVWLGLVRLGQVRLG